MSQDPLSSAPFPVLASPTESHVHGSEIAEDALSRSHARRLRELVDEEHTFVWRSLRRLGVSLTDVDDATQKVFLVAARRLPTVPLGRERAFLFATAMRVASNERRAERRKRSAGAEPLDALVSSSPSPEEVAADRVLLDTLLEPLPIELRSIIVLYELEQLTTEEIGEMLELPPGTVASRIRRAREQIELVLKRLRAQEGRLG